MTLSDSRMDRYLAAPLRPLPSPFADLPQLPGWLSRRAMSITPADRSRCICRLLPKTVLPYPFSGRVGVNNVPFEACSDFTRVTAHRFARPPEEAFVAGLLSSRLPDQTACQLPGQPTVTRMRLALTSQPRFWGAPDFTDYAEQDRGSAKAVQWTASASPDRANFHSSLLLCNLVQSMKSLVNWLNFAAYAH